MDKYLKACEKGIHWVLGQQKDDGSLNMPEPCFDGLYKFPAAMITRGRNREAAMLLNWLEMKTLKGNGDFAFPKAKVVFGWHKNFYTYTNSWIVIAAQKAGFFHLANKAAGYLLQYQNAQTGAFQSLPIETASEGWCDTTITGNCGIACLFTGFLSQAFRAADALCDITEQQDGGPVYYYTMDADGKIIRDIPEENKLWYRLDSREPGQCYWYVGISAALLCHCHEIKPSQRYLRNALGNLTFLENCNSDILSSFASGKYGYASALAYRITGEEKYRDIALQFCDWLVQVQKKDGRWTVDSSDYAWYLTWDCTAEMVYWISEIISILSSAKKMW